MSAKIYVARHGQDEDNASGILNGHRNRPLTSVGVEQARTVASKIKKKKLTFDAVYSSPLDRARRTAEILVGDAAKVNTMDSIIERDFGIMTGIPIRDIKERCGNDVLQTDTITYFLSPDGAETFPDLIQRGTRVIEEIREKHSDGSSVLLVTHGDFGKMLYAAFYKLDWQDVLRKFHFGNSEVLLLSDDSSPEETFVFQVEQCNP